MTQRPSEFTVYAAGDPNVYASVSRDGAVVVLAAGTAEGVCLVPLSPGIANELAKAILQASQAAEAQQ